MKRVGGAWEQAAAKPCRVERTKSCRRRASNECRRLARSCGNAIQEHLEAVLPWAPFQLLLRECESAQPSIPAQLKPVGRDEKSLECPPQGRKSLMWQTMRLEYTAKRLTGRSRAEHAGWRSSAPFEYGLRMQSISKLKY